MREREQIVCDIEAHRSYWKFEEVSALREMGAIALLERDDLARVVEGATRTFARRALRAKWVQRELTALLIASDAGMFPAEVEEKLAALFWKKDDHGHLPAICHAWVAEQVEHLARPTASGRSSLPTALVRLKQTFESLQRDQLAKFLSSLSPEQSESFASVARAIESGEDLPSTAIVPPRKGFDIVVQSFNEIELAAGASVDLRVTPHAPLDIHHVALFGDLEGLRGDILCGYTAFTEVAPLEHHMFVPPYKLYPGMEARLRVYSGRATPVRIRAALAGWTPTPPQL